MCCSAINQLLYTGTAVPPATLAHKEAWIGVTERYVLGLLPCAGGIAPRCAVLAVQRHTYSYIHTAVLLFVAAYVPLEDVCCSPKNNGK